MADGLVSDVAEFDPARLIGVLADCGVRFVVIGGLAALIHGCPFPTVDLDITPDTSADNLAALSEALTRISARVRVAGEPVGLPFAPDATSLADASTWNLVTDAGDLDIAFVPDGTKGYVDLVRSATEVSALGVRIPVASLGDVIRSKQAANRPKDQRVLPVLRQILASSPRP